MHSKQKLSAEVLKNALIGGDVLVVLRYENDVPTIQVIDGELVSSPVWYGGSSVYAPDLPNGNRIENGIELSKSNEHIAFYVKRKGITLEVDRIPARSEETGLLMAFMVYGTTFRLDTHRGIPLIAVVLETIKKLERYKEATVGSAEERQKIAYFIEHMLGSDGSNPLIQQLAHAAGFNADRGDLAVDDAGQEMANKIAVSTNKQVFNLPIQSTLKSLESKGELYFKDFYTVNLDVICAVIGIPPNVAMMKYDSNYSASRAAIKDWEHVLKVRRFWHSEDFEKPVYSFWAHIAIFQGILQAPGFVTAWLKKQWYITEAYLKARFIGPNVPNIDPLKEVEAVRKKLGNTADSIPLTTVEAATEELDGGGSDENMEQFADELEQSKKLGIKPEPEPIALPPAQ